MRIFPVNRRRFLAVFFLCLFVFNTLFTTFSYALTSGPTAPEATSFEPVDTTDMVNLASGDFTYNIPLLEVPGPSGGYPLSLSYHAGLSPDEEASWAGLGWTLNPGAITRNVSGIPDDHFGALNAEHIFWTGTERETVKVGVNIGIAGVAGVSAGLTFSQDRYQGFGVGAFAEADLDVKGIGIKAGIEYSPYDGISGSMGISVGLGGSIGKAIDLSGSASLSTNFHTVSADVSGTGNAFGLMDASISSVGGASARLSSPISISINNSKSDKISSSTFSITLPLPFITLGYSYERYWIDETEYVNTYGSLYNPTASVSTGFDNAAYDSYTLADPTSNFSTTPDADKVIGGTFLGYDNYSVSAQGLGGSIRPYSFKNLAFRQNRKKTTTGYEVKQFPYAAGYQNSPFEFRFIGDFSNKFTRTGGAIPGGSPVPLVPTFETSGFTEKTGENDTDGIVGGHLMGSRHIEWYSNAQILNFDNSKNPETEGFIDTNTSGFQRSVSGTLGKQIGAFKITNESGVTYHYALPAYNYDDFSYSGNTKLQEGEEFYNTSRKPEKYAYTWFLTAITGPDYVDRGGAQNAANGKLDENDWGYWVEFVYGKWTNDFTWRNPAVGYQQDLDTDFRNYSSGKKEIYYLDAVKTKTHTALFIKDVRVDGKSTDAGRGLLDKSDLGFNPKQYTGTGGVRQENFSLVQGGCVPIWSYDKVTPVYSHTAFPVSLMALKSIYLVKNEALKSSVLNNFQNGTLNELKAYGNIAEFSIPVAVTNNRVHVEPACEELNGQCICSFQETAAGAYSSSESMIIHEYDNVLDVTDLNAYASVLKENSTRVIDLGQSFNLVPETPNSFTNPALYTNSPPTNPAAYPLQGKLTLDNLTFKGKGGADLMPPMVFNYELENPKTGYGAFSINAASGYPYTYSLEQSNSGLMPGDIIKVPSSAGTMYAVVKATNGVIHTLMPLGRYTVANESLSWTQTKNPPYNKDKTDIWGSYKSDYLEKGSYNADHLVTPVSSQSADVWSLRQVVSSIGAKINVSYESDAYEFAGKSLTDLLINSITIVDDVNHKMKVTFQNEIDLTKVSGFAANMTVQLLGMLRFRGDQGPQYSCDGMLQNFVYTFENVDEAVLVVSIASDHIIIQNTNLTNQLSKTLGLKGYDMSDATLSLCDANSACYFFNWPAEFTGGTLHVPGVASSLGGGVRVSAITILNSNTISSTKYAYSDGATSYEPLKFATPLSGSPEFQNSCMMMLENNKRAEFKLVNFNNLFVGNISLLTIARDVPPPGVVYGSVTVTESVNGNDLPNASRYTFEVFNERTVGYKNSSVRNNGVTASYNSVDYKRDVSKDITISDLSGQIGQLRKVELLDANGKVLNATVNKFLHDEATGATLDDWLASYRTKMARFNSQGMIQETIMDGRFAKVNTTDFHLLSVVSRKHYYPIIKTGQTSINYITGITTTSETLSFDFYSGQALKTLTTDGYGNNYVSESVPAYRVNAYKNGMGLAAMGGRNMITQEAASYAFKVNGQYKDTPTDQNILAVVSAGAQTWSEDVPVLTLGSQGNIWRKANSYSFIGDPTAGTPVDGLYPIAGFGKFAAWTPADNLPPVWQKDTEITLYDVASHALEAKDLNGNFAATKLTLDNSIVLARGANAAYTEFTYSGVEENLTTPGYFGGGVYVDGSKVSQAHTGVTGVSATTNNRGFTYSMIPKQRSYMVSVWSSQADANIKYKIGAGSPVTLTVNQVGKAGSWYLLEGTIDATNTTTTHEIWCEAKVGTTVFDDFRVNPLDGPVTSYVYNSWGELSHILDANNLFTEFQYDGMGKLLRTYKEVFDPTNTTGKTKISEQEFIYGLNGSRVDASLTVNSPTSFTATVTYGHPPYHYEWYVNNTLIQQSNSSTATSTFTSSVTCPNTVSFVVTDDREGSKTLQAQGGSDPTASVSFTGPSSPVKGTTYNFVSTVNGACGPYTVSWSAGPILGPYFKAGTTSTLSYAFPVCGMQRVICTMTDASGTVTNSFSRDYFVTGTGCWEIQGL